MAKWIRLQNVILLTSLVLTACSEADKPSSGMYGGLLNQENFSSAKAHTELTIKFPQDHLSHPEFAIEWWYLTANLFDQQGNQYPLQWTLFRFSGGVTDSNWSDGQLYMSHGKLSSKTDDWFEEVFARGGVGNADVSLAANSNAFTAYLDDWQWRSESADLFPATLNFNLNEDVNIRLTMKASGPYVLHGENGYSIKLSNHQHASMYYSQPFIDITGVIELPTAKIEVSGQGWFDHEWSAGLSDQATEGWDWFSLHLQDGRKLMLYQVRHGQLRNSWFGSLISSNGDKTHLTEQDIAASINGYSEIDGVKVPLNWSISLPQHQIDIRVSAFKKDQYNRGMFPYYEGAVSIEGSHKGLGFMELTGY
ncbi:lipocalin-like domain-containing protein [Aliiglaciecola lipolytica]|uniref:lipocalin-like domain-containing protein n=1 Tax=Aliiglaciecola lipolytica TaxID=477689 RepID=UPI001C08DD4E|nr:lipocalin-like domain-containing protein [Aliiglaciecola lipolytica]MBU2879743.1 carotenoid 1,2-hydratase [Aliiglaciecola lipolytica]